MTALRLILARHGQTTANVAGVLDTPPPGPGLTDLGREQATALGRELATTVHGVDALYHSRARRAGETARLAGTELGLVPQALDGVHELQVGDLEGRSDDAAIAEFRGAFEAWHRGDLDRAQPGGESARDVLARFLPAVGRIEEHHRDGGTVVLVSHGAALRLVAPVLIGQDAVPAPDQAHLGNGGRIVMRRDGWGWVLEEWRSAVPGAASTHDPTG